MKLTKVKMLLKILFSGSFVIALFDSNNNIDVLTGDITDEQVLMVADILDSSVEDSIKTDIFMENVIADAEGTYPYN